MHEPAPSVQSLYYRLSVVLYRKLDLSIVSKQNKIYTTNAAFFFNKRNLCFNFQHNESS